jgi:quinol monooxygenase YgiN
MGFVVIATWTAKAGEADRVAGTLSKLAPGNRAEPKNLVFQAHRSTEDPNTFVLYEHYTDAAGYDDHKATDAFQTHVIGDIIPRLETRTVSTFTTLE